MTRKITLANQKGGTGKTTSAINIACGWARAIGPDRVLLVDLDPQANATSVAVSVEVAAGPRRPNLKCIKEVLLEEVAAEDALLAVDLDEIRSSKGFTLSASNLHVLPSHLELAVVEGILSNTFRGEYRLRKQLEPIVGNYDVIIVDCPPSLGTLTLNGLLFSEEVVIPVDPGLFPLIGLGLLLNTIERAREANPKLRISGVLPTLFTNTVVARDTYEQLTENFEGLLLPTIPQRTIINESHMVGQDVFSYAPNTDGAEAYYDVIQMLMKQG